MKISDIVWNKRKIAAAIVGAFMALTLCLAGILYFLDDRWVEKGKITGEVYFFEQNLGGMTAAEAEKAVGIVIENRMLMPIQLYTEKNEWVYTAQELGLVNNSRAVAEVAYQVGRGGTIFDRYKERFFSAALRHDLEIGFELDDNVLTAEMAVISEEEGTTAENAYFYMDDGGNLAIEPSINGSAVNIERTAADIKTALSTMETTKVLVTVDADAEPPLTTADLEAMNMTGVLASFSTRYNAGQGDRSHNIWQAAQYLDMKLLLPGQTFSFNEIVGKRTAERGFREAPIIENGQFTDGRGGGVCQVSTTLYGAVIRTDMMVLARQPHSLKIAYVDPGQDAMVAWGSSDLMFRNDYDTPVLLHATAGGGIVSMTFYGEPSLVRNVRIVSDVVSYLPFSTETILDPSLGRGETRVRSSGHRGLECYVYKYIYDENGVEIGSTTVSHDTYKPQKRIIAQGT